MECQTSWNNNNSVINSSVYQVGSTTIINEKAERETHSKNHLQASDYTRESLQHKVTALEMKVRYSGMSYSVKQWNGMRVEHSPEKETWGGVTNKGHIVQDLCDKCNKINTTKNKYFQRRPTIPVKSSLNIKTGYKDHDTTYTNAICQSAPPQRTYTQALACTYAYTHSPPSVQ